MLEYVSIRLLSHLSRVFYKTFKYIFCASKSFKNDGFPFINCVNIYLVPKEEIDKVVFANDEMYCKNITFVFFHKKKKRQPNN